MTHMSENLLANVLSSLCSSSSHFSCLGPSWVESLGGSGRGGTFSILIFSDGSSRLEAYSVCKALLPSSYSLSPCSRPGLSSETSKSSHSYLNRFSRSIRLRLVPRDTDSPTGFWSFCFNSSFYQGDRSSLNSSSPLFSETAYSSY